MGRAVPGQSPVALVAKDETLVRLVGGYDMVEQAGFDAASDADEAIDILESRDDIRAVFTDACREVGNQARVWRKLIVGSDDHVGEAHPSLRHGDVKRLALGVIR